MPNVTSKTFDQLVNDQVTAIQSKAQSLIDFAIGSILRAIVETNSAVALWIQGILLQLLATTRAATSSGTDLDSWGSDFGFTRLPAIAATGMVTFSRFSITLGAFIPANTQVQTSDTSPETFTVTADSTNAYWNAALNGYSVPAGTVSIAVPVLCSVAGTIGNVLAGQCNTLTGSIPGIDTVTNAAAFTSGKDAETDTAFRVRFVAYLSSLSKATKNAISAAIAAVQAGLSFTLTENYNYAGTLTPGYFYAVVDDGSGYPSSGLLASINNAIDLVRGFTITFGVYAPVLQTANVAMTVASVNHAADAVLAQAAVSAYIASLGLGAKLPYTKLAQIAYDASPTITNVSAVTLNGGTADINTTAQQRVIAGTIVVS